MVRGRDSGGTKLCGGHSGMAACNLPFSVATFAAASPSTDSTHRYGSRELDRVAYLLCMVWEGGCNWEKDCEPTSENAIEEKLEKYEKGRVQGSERFERKRERVYACVWCEHVLCCQKEAIRDHEGEHTRMSKDSRRGIQIQNGSHKERGASSANQHAGEGRESGGSGAVGLQRRKTGQSSGLA